MVDVSILLQQKKIKKDGYEIMIECLDTKCNEIRVRASKQQSIYEETVSMFDFVDVRNRLKLGHSLESVQKGSLLFLKLMLENTDDENYRIFPLKEMPWKKVLRGEDSAKNIVQTHQNENAKGLAIFLSKSLILILPLVLVDLPAPNKSTKKVKDPDENIKKMFFDELK